MKAVALHRYGGPDQLEYTDLPVPRVGPDSVLVRVKAAGVNPVDWKVAGGHLDAILDAHFPLVPGWDVAGVVERTGADAGEFSPGDEVIGYVRRDEAQHGTYAELVSAPVRTLARKPTALTWQQAAGLPLAGLTAHQCLKRLGLGEIARGKTVLVHAAAGGVGSMAVQLAAALGARVIGTAGESNHAYLRELGAEPVTYGDGLPGRVRALAPDGVDAALDFVGGEAVEVSQKVLKDPGRVVSVVDTGVVEKGGAYLFVRPDREDLAALADRAEEGLLTVHVNRTLPLRDAAGAWRLSMSGKVRGKVVLEL
ncbi:NADP-dependent oxidoreductase [Streptomyces sp. ACA25]|uniref:NADP-dependent oxidoreductase n=1 Tax=Streptomyces sp. ACA25 TaxID=3022596 RepID=UPI00230779AA|nr:NADP-dependent oxidoreductase [Streptomyces sp. ACA25]MDB1089279.1 NADP-dependent oxidoreductase [Streptomyces sp. ACA25]